MTFLKYIFGVVIFVTFSFFSANADIYWWTDKDGVKRYSNKSYPENAELLFKSEKIPPGKTDNKTPETVSRPGSGEPSVETEDNPVTVITVPGDSNSNKRKREEPSADSPEGEPNGENRSNTKEMERRDFEKKQYGPESKIGSGVYLAGYGGFMPDVFPGTAGGPQRDLFNSFGFYGESRAYRPGFDSGLRGNNFEFDRNDRLRYYDRFRDHRFYDFNRHPRFGYPSLYYNEKYNWRHKYGYPFNSPYYRRFDKDYDYDDRFFSPGLGHFYFNWSR